MIAIAATVRRRAATVSCLIRSEPADYPLRPCRASVVQPTTDEDPLMGNLLNLLLYLPTSQREWSWWAFTGTLVIIGGATAFAPARAAG